MALEMMLKSMLGIDPTEIKARIEEGLAFFEKTIVHFDGKITTLQTTVDLLVKQVDALEAHLLQIKE